MIYCLLLTVMAAGAKFDRASSMPRTALGAVVSLLDSFERRLLGSIGSCVGVSVDVDAVRFGVRARVVVCGVWFEAVIRVGGISCWSFVDDDVPCCAGRCVLAGVCSSIGDDVLGSGGVGVVCSELVSVGWFCL